MKHFSSLSLIVVVSLTSLALATNAFYSAPFLAAIACVFVLLIAAGDYAPKHRRPLKQPAPDPRSSAANTPHPLRLAA
jgi:hypothetical protein